MNVVQIVDTLSLGGAQKQIVTFAALSRKFGLNVTVANLGSDEVPFYANELKSLGAHVVDFPGNALLDAKRFYRLYRFLKENPFDVAHTHLAYANILGVMACRFAGIPVVSSLHSTGHFSMRSARARNFLETWTLRYLTYRVLAVGYKVEEANKTRLGKKTMIVLPNTALPSPQLTSAERDNIRIDLVGDPDCLLVITAGRFAPPKGYDQLVESFSLLAKRLQSVKLVMVGDGPLFDEVKSKIRAKGLENTIRLVGAREDVLRLLSASDLYVSSSLWEGLPMAILEAMMAGLTVVATDVGDIPRVVVPGTGTIVPPGQPQAMAEAMEYLLRNESIRIQMGYAAQKHVEDTYSVDRWMDQLIAVYNGVIR